MSDSKGWVGTPDRERIRGLMARSANVIAAAHEDLDKSSDDIERLSSEPGSKKRKRRPKFPTLPTLTKSPLKPSSSRQGLPKRAPFVAPAAETPPAPQPLPPSSSELEPARAEHRTPPTVQGVAEEPALPGSPTLPFEPVEKHETASAHRRAVFRQFLRTRDIGDVRTLERFQRANAEDATAVEIGPGATDESVAPEDAVPEDAAAPEDTVTPADVGGEIKGWRLRLRKKRLETSSLDGGHAFEADRDRRVTDERDREPDDPPYDLKREAPWQGARFTHEPWEKRVDEPEPDAGRKRSLLARWNQRLDALTNTIAGVLIATLLAVSAIGASPFTPSSPAGTKPDTASGSQNSVNPKTRAPRGLAPAGAQSAAPQSALSPALPSARGIGIHERRFPTPLPARPTDVSTMLFWSRPSPGSAPGLAVIPYADLPQALPGVPPDIEGHIMMTTPQR